MTKTVSIYEYKYKLIELRSDLYTYNKLQLSAYDIESIKNVFFKLYYYNQKSYIRILY